MGILIAAPPLAPDERQAYAFLANHCAGSRSVGGRLSVTDRALYFTPHRLDALARAKPLRLDFSDVISIEAQVKDGSGLIAGGFRDRLRIRTRDATFLFVVNRLSERIDALQRSVENSAERRRRAGGSDSS